MSIINDALSGVMSVLGGSPTRRRKRRTAKGVSASTRKTLSKKGMVVIKKSTLNALKRKKTSYGRKRKSTRRF